eukprot:TRINITY_DN3186_c0_g3_i2.p2 TRINITY_DN3186_c0_g3~~TRINITY_DN3186_c0_g3_i2.p2  ORF type:complete len:129 (+),score=40.20 TRINITY_DN3186_c0_g3_i2:33-389(+)
MEPAPKRAKREKLDTSNPVSSWLVKFPPEVAAALRAARSGNPVVVGTLTLPPGGLSGAIPLALRIPGAPPGLPGGMAVRVRAGGEDACMVVREGFGRGYGADIRTLWVIARILSGGWQ